MDWVTISPTSNVTKFLDAVGNWIAVCQGA